MQPGRRCQQLAMVGLAVLGLPAPAAAAASPWSDHQVVAARLIAGAPGADGSGRLGLHFRLAPGWHVYWKHPGDAGAPPQLSLAAGSAAGGGAGAAVEAELRYPAPQRFRLPGGLEALGYEGEVVYPLRLPKPPPHGQELTASVDYVACAVECIPFHDELTLAAAAEGGRAADTEDELLRRWEARLPRSLESTGLSARLTYSAGERPELALELTGPAAAGERAELFLEPAPGATFGTPEPASPGGALGFRVAVRPEVAGETPKRLRVAWTLTGLRVAGEVVAVADVAEVAAEGEAVSDPPSSSAVSQRKGDRAPRVGRWGPILRAAIAGGLLALNPAGLTLLLLLRHRRRGDAGNLPSDMGANPPPRSPPGWPTAAVAATAMAFALAALHFAGRAAGTAAPLAEPVAAALLALPALAVTLLLWVAPEVLAAPSPLLLAALSPLPALAWLPLAGWSATPPAPQAIALASGFAVPFLAAGLLRRSTGATPLPPPRALGFVAAAGLVWSAYRLATLLPAARLAGVQLAWLAAGLGARSAATASGARRAAWLAFALAAAAFSLWAASTPAMLSP